MAVFVLVHGGFLGGWCWKKVKKILEAQGHEVYTPTLTGLGEREHLNSELVSIDLHIQDLKNHIFFENLHSVILVGHSYAGLIISAVASQLNDRIKQIIYLDALVPDNGDSLLTLVDIKLANFFISQVKDKGFGSLVPAFEIKKEEFAYPIDIDWFNERLTPQLLKSFEQKIYFNSTILYKIPKIFIHCSKNLDTTLQRMKIKAQKSGMHYFEIATNHFPMINNPQELSDLLVFICRNIT